MVTVTHPFNATSMFTASNKKVKIWHHFVKKDRCNSHSDDEEVSITNTAIKSTLSKPPIVKRPVGRPCKSINQPIDQSGTSSTATASASTSRLSSASIKSKVGYKGKKIDWLKDPVKTTLILEAVTLHPGKWQAAVDYLIDNYGVFFHGLRRNTLCGWFRLTEDGSNYEWNTSAASRVEQCEPRQWFVGPTPLVARYPAAVQQACLVVHSLREAGAAVNASSIHALIQCIFDKYDPCHGYIITPRWVRGFLVDVARFSYRRVTSAAQKIPDDARVKVEDMVARIAQLMARYDVPPQLVINTDQTGLILIPAANYTYESRQSKFAAVIGAEEKRAITAVVGSSLAGMLLPLQLIFQGQDNNPDQKRSVPVLERAKTRAFIESAKWHLTQSHNHWSTLATMKDYVVKILIPHYMLHRRSADDHMIWVIDSWSVHRSREFLDYLAQFHFIHIVFVPAHCTGIAQPADVGLQRPIKARFRKEFQKYCVRKVKEAMEDGGEPTSWKMDDGIKKLKKLAVVWLMRSFKAVLARPELVRGAWTRCEGLEKLLDPVFVLSKRNVRLGEAPVEVEEDHRSGEDRSEHNVDNNIIDEPEDDVTRAMAATSLLM